MCVTYIQNEGVTGTSYYGHSKFSDPKYSSWDAVLEIR